MDHVTPAAVSSRSKEAHLVTDITALLLNPISDQPTSTPSYDDMMEGESHQNSVAEEDPKVTMNGPDTSSFTAFLYSLLSSSESGASSESGGYSHVEDQNQLQSDTNQMASDPRAEESNRSKSSLSRGKKSHGRAICQALQTNGCGHQASEDMADCNSKVDGSDQCGIELGPLQPSVELKQVRLPDISEPSLLLSEKARSSLHASLPIVVQGRKWVLIYSTWRHGISLSTLYRRSVLFPGFSLLVVGDSKGSVFGGLVEAPLRPTNKRKYQGTHDTFVFTNTSGSPIVFRPTGANRYFTLCGSDFLALGGGGHFALYLDGDLLSGSTSVSETFGNPCLALSQDFQVKEVELWSFTTTTSAPPSYAEAISFWRTKSAAEMCR